LRGKDPAFDIFGIDVVWPGDFAEDFLDLTPFFTEEETKQHIESIWANDNVNGRQVAVPFFADYALLYYRKDCMCMLLRVSLVTPNTN
jgi:trehalose/maltose transport system substrate-binding protein